MSDGTDSLISTPAYVAWYGRGRKQNWTTPRALFDRINADYGFTMDGASEPGNGLLPLASTVEAPLPWTNERVFWQVSLLCRGSGLRALRCDAPDGAC